jgi:hypothetical protein
MAELGNGDGLNPFYVTDNEAIIEFSKLIGDL